MYVAGNEEFRLQGTPVYVDVEGIPDTEFYYLIGIRFNDGQKVVQHSLWAETEADEIHIWRQFIEIISSIEDPVIVHFGAFETTYLRHMYRRYGAPPPDSKLAKAVHNAVNVVSFIYSKVYFPTYSNGLKDIARFLGFRWTNPAAKGISTVIWRKDWEDSKAQALKKDIVVYNAEDCEALACVADFLASVTPRKAEARSFGGPEIIMTDSLFDGSLHRYRRIDFQVKALEEINRTAYWDYQHRKIQVRSSDRLRKLAKIAGRKAAVKTHVDRTVNWPMASQCPKCGCSILYKYEKYAKDFVDLHFGRNGIKKTLTRFMFHRYLCTGCRFTFITTDPAWSRLKYGRNLMSFAIYLILEVGVTQSKVASLLNDLFGLGLSRMSVMHLKTRAAELYADAYREILATIIAGPVIHVDETQINLKGKVGYVWVFANAESVFCVHTPSRDASLVHDLLKDFDGVLVSDFYGAYDSLDCPQQRCLLHLIRDVNEDLTKEPFNDEIRLLANDFAEVLSPIIKTVDRFGLKARYLRKHKKAADRFFKSLSERQLLTETGAKWKKRFEKNRSRLFTFLDYDGVPWNNNNAEHAVKAVAYLRRDLSGLSTEAGIRDYLTLLSLRETCRFQGISFLDFLRSEERGVDSFVRRRIRFDQEAGLPSQNTAIYPEGVNNPSDVPK